MNGRAFGMSGKALLNIRACRPSPTSLLAASPVYAGYLMSCMIHDLTQDWYLSCQRLHALHRQGGPQEQEQ